MFRLSNSEAKKAGLKVAKSNKYGVRQDSLGKLGRSVDGIKFDSQKEANRYCELKVLEKAGKISNLALQPSWPLKCGDKTIGKYVGDFAYNPKEHPWMWVVEDVKGMKTPLYRWKKKHFEAQYGIEIREV